jgi:hypothetical protein
MTDKHDPNWRESPDLPGEVHDEPEEFLEFEPMLTCPVCEGGCSLLGTLGNREHWRCNDCGMEFSRSIADDAQGE